MYPQAVKVVETATANLPLNKNFNGELKSNSEAIYKLQNKNGKWKVIYDEVIDESTSMSCRTNGDFAC